jgi:hypothetical protein
LKYPVPGIFICVSNDQWQHHFQEDNYLPVDALSPQQVLEYCSRNNFIKLAIKFPLQQPADAAIFLQKSFKDLVELVKL